MIGNTIYDNIVYGVDNLITEKNIEEVLVKTDLKEFISSLPKGLQTGIGTHEELLSLMEVISVD